MVCHLDFVMTNPFLSMQVCFFFFPFFWVKVQVISIISIHCQYWECKFYVSKNKTKVPWGKCRCYSERLDHYTVYYNYDVSLLLHLTYSLSLYLCATITTKYRVQYQFFFQFCYKYDQWEITFSTNNSQARLIK